MTTTEKVLRAERFELVDQEGTVRAVLGPITPHRYALTFHDRTGKPRVGIGFSTDDGSGLVHLIGAHSTVGLMVDDNGVAKVVVERIEGARLGLGVTPEGLASLSVFDEK